MQSEMLQQLYAQIISDLVHGCTVGCWRRSTAAGVTPAHFLDALTVGGALTASEVAAVVAAWLTLHNNHFLTIITDSEAFTDNSFYNKEVMSTIIMKFSAISPYFHDFTALLYAALPLSCMYYLEG